MSTPWRRIRAVHFGALVAITLAAGPVFAHDFWIEPGTFEPEVGSVVPIRLRVGQHFEGDPVPRDDGRILRFVMFENGRETPMESPDGSDPAGRVRIGSPGIHVIGYRSTASSIELEPRKFEQYLAEEGLEGIIAARSKRGESGKPGREIYSRCAKCLLLAPDPDPGDERERSTDGRSSKSGSKTRGDSGKRAGKDRTAGYDRVLGFTLELVPRANPFVAPSDGKLPVDLLFQGRPLAGALVVAMNADEPERLISARSDRSGRVRLQLGREGAWLVKAVHMVPAPAGVDADWESLWASLTFDRPAM